MITLNLEPVIHLSAEQFIQLCYANPDAKLELTTAGELVVMSPTGGESGSRNLKLSQRLGNWTDSDGTGIAFDSSSMFELSSLAFRSPDASWISLAVGMHSLMTKRKRFRPFVPILSSNCALHPILSQICATRCKSI
jgi:Uma2 family endonuclease